MPTKYTYTGQYSYAGSGEFGLLFYVARWYDPVLGRFSSADTIVPGAGNPMAWDRYAYALNSPTNFIDPTGHFAKKDIPRLCPNCKSWDEVKAYYLSLYGSDTGDLIYRLLKHPGVTWGSILIAGNQDTASAQFSFIIINEGDNYRLGLWDLKNDTEADLGSVIGSYSHVTVWSDSNRVNPSGYQFITSVKGAFSDMGVAEDWAKPVWGNFNLLEYGLLIDNPNYRTFVNACAICIGKAYLALYNGLKLGWRLNKEAIDLYDFTVDMGELITSNFIDDKYPIMYTDGPPNPNEQWAHPDQPIKFVVSFLDPW